MTALRTLLDRGPVRRKITLLAGLAVMLLAVVHTWWPGEPIGSDWMGLALYLCGATVLVLSALPRSRPPVDRSNGNPGH